MKALQFFLCALPAVTALLECHSEPVLPLPRNLGQSATFKAALDGLANKLDAAVRGEIKAGWDINNISLSIGIVGLDQDEPGLPVWEYHHLAKGNVNGTKNLDRHSQYLIGSVSKVITDAMLLRSGVDLDRPITDFLPELRSVNNMNGSSLIRIRWEDITLRALAGQMAGIPTNYGFSEYHYIKFFFEYLGFPRLNDTAFPSCGVIGLNPGCTQQQLLTNLLTVNPTASSFTHPVYSNIAFVLASYTLTAHTSQPYPSLLASLITTPLNLSSTFPAPGNSSLAVIPPTPNNWGSSYGDNVPAGGLVSTLSDLSSFVHAILTANPSLGLTKSQLDAWKKPHAFTGSQYSFVGMPWEIFRPPPEALFPFSDEEERDEYGRGEGRGHTVTILSKGGGAYGYHAHVALIEEYGVGIAVLTAGGENAVMVVVNALLSVVVPALDKVAREQVREEYVGGYFGKERDGVHVNATVELDGLSLKLTGLGRNGSDILAGLGELWNVTVAGFLPSRLTGVYRIYPAEVERRETLPGGGEVVLEDWRFQWDIEFDMKSDLPGSQLSGKDCLSWTLTDWMHYGSEPIDRVVFVKDAKTGNVLGLDVPFLRTGVMGKAKLKRQA